MMQKFDFLLGHWLLDYSIPRSTFSEAMTGAGTGTFKRALNDKYVYLDYAATFSSGDKCQAHGIFAWDEKLKLYRYWWFEDSGTFMTASCRFVNEETLFMNWHDTLLIQTFTKKAPDRVVLKMENPNSEGQYELVLEVAFTRATAEVS
ncbi:MAG: hypothetical protein DKINENOH_01252 [bacterium]|nr:hypothetical protein [bacterium]